MAREKRGTIPDDGVVSLLRRFEDERTSGLLAYRASNGERGEVWLRLGQLDTAIPLAADGTDPVERFLATRGGTYELLDRLPPLEDSEGSDRIRVGSLGRHSIADLMNYAESAGLTGLVRVERDTRVAEIQYKNGTPDSIYLDGDEKDVDEVFGWGTGRFSIRIEGTPSIFPRGDSSDSRSEPKVIERPLGEVLDEAAQRRPRSASIPPPRVPGPREGTVRIVMLGGQGEALVSLASAKAGAEARARDSAPERQNTPRVANRSIERRASRASVTRASDAEPDSLMPRTAVIVLALVLFSGIAAFVAVLMRMS